MKYKFPSNVHHVFRLNPELKMVPEFDVLSNKQMCYVMLICDPESPLRYIKFGNDGGTETMKIQAAKSIGFGTPTGKLGLNGEKMVKGNIPILRLAERVYEKIVGADDLECLLETKINIREYMRNKPTDEDAQTKWSTQTRAYIKENTMGVLNEQISKHRKLKEIQAMADLSEMKDDPSEKVKEAPKAKVSKEVNIEDVDNW